MTVTELTDQVLSLPPDERAALAQKVWESLDDSQVDISPDAEAEALKVALRRDAEMENGTVAQRDHEEVMEKARRSAPCE